MGVRFDEVWAHNDENFLFLIHRGFGLLTNVSNETSISFVVSLNKIVVFAERDKNCES